MPHSGRYFGPLNPVAKEQYIEKLLLLNSTGDNGPYSDKASKNSIIIIISLFKEKGSIKGSRPI